MLIGLLALLTATPAAAATRPGPDRGRGLTPVPEAAPRMAELVNRERTAAGLAPLGADDEVAAIAARWAGAMAAAGEISHNHDYLSDESLRRLNASRLGENVAVADSVDEIHRLFMASTPHRDNILKPEFRLLGVGAVRATDGNLYLTEDFVTRQAPPPPSPRRSTAGSAAPRPSVARRSTAGPAAPRPSAATRPPHALRLPPARVGSPGLSPAPVGPPPAAAPAAALPAVEPLSAQPAEPAPAAGVAAPGSADRAAPGNADPAAGSSAVARPVPTDGTAPPARDRSIHSGDLIKGLPVLVLMHYWRRGRRHGR